MKRVTLFILLTVLAVTLIACNNEEPTPTPEPEPTATSAPEVAPEETVEEATAEPEMGTAVVDTVTINPESNTATAAGNLPDGCTEIDQTTQSVDGSTINIEITTIRPADMMCTTALEPYTQEIAIDTSGLADGEYNVVVNGVAGEQPIVVGTPTTPVTQTDLINTNWQWADLVETEPAAQSAVPNPENYTIAFFEDNTVSIKADCNQVGGSYTLDGNNLTIQTGPSTMAFCGENSLDQQYLMLLAEVTGGSLEDGRLILLTSENARMGFNNGGTAEAATSEAAETIEATKTIDPSMVSIDTQGLPYPYQVNYVAETPYDESQPPGPMGLPAHLQINFGNTSERQPGDPVIYIIPVAAYEAMWQANGNDSINSTMGQIAMQTYLLPQPPATSGYPALPVEEVVGANDLAVQVDRAATVEQQSDDMASKSGYRFVGRWAQDANPVTNQNLRYVYQGFTNDGEYLVAMFWPVSTSQLPADASGVSEADMTAFNNDPTAAITAQAEALNELTPADWEPDLATLDAMIRSLQITDMSANGLVNKTWQWYGEVINPSSGEITINETDEGTYAITFNADGTFNAQIDCNNSSGNVSVEGGIAGSIGFEPGPSTLAECGENSQADTINGLLAATQDFRVVPAGNEMNLIMPAAGGDYVFAANPANFAAVSEAPGPINRAIGQTWQWTQFTNPATGEEAISEPERYQLVLNEDGTVNVKADCNMVAGTYTAEGNSISFTFGPSTAAACPEDSLADQYLQYLSAAAIVFFQDDSMYFDLFADSGTMKFDVASDSSTSSDEETEEAAELSGDAVQINLQGLAQSYEWSVQDAAPSSPGLGGTGVPRHILVTFDSEDPARVLENQGRRLYIFPIEAYQEVGGDPVVTQVERLEQLIDIGAGSDPMPLLPPPSSYMNRWAQYANLDFADGTGVRYVSDSPFRQQIGVWSNDVTAYYYQGLTSDGRFYLSLVWPISTEALPDTADTAPEDVKAVATDPDANADYIAAVQAELNELAPADFNPDLAKLDALVASITLQE